MSITQVEQQYRQHSEQIIMDAVRKAYPHLDLRDGTALRETVIRTDGVITAINRGLADEIRKDNSLEAALEDLNAPATTIAGVLANYGVIPRKGTPSTGYVRITVASSAPLVIPRDTLFNLGGLEYRVPQTVVARTSPTFDEAILSPGADGGYAVTVPVVAAGIGTSYDLPAYTVLSTGANIQGLIDVMTVTPIAGGSDVETVSDALGRIPAMLAYPAPDGVYQATNLLAGGIPEAESIIRASSVCGTGDVAQRRDRRNIFGVPIGGKVDMFVRTFGSPQLHVLKVTATRNDDGKYVATLGAHNAPPFCIVASVGSSINTASSYGFTLSIGGVSREHGLTPRNPTDAAFTVFQTQTLTIDAPNTGEEEQEVYVTLWLAPGLDVMQQYLDSPAVKYAHVDVLVRAPVLCQVSGHFSVVLPATSNVTERELQQALVDYVNTRSFTGRLSRAELSALLVSKGVTHVHLLPDASTISGRCIGADGTEVEQIADIIDIDDFEDPDNLITRNSVVFTALPDSFSVNVLQG